MPTVLAMLMLFLAALAAPTASVRAQSSDVGSFLNAFPEGDRYKVQVWGDAMSEGLLDGLSDLLVEETRFQLDKKHRWLGGLMKADAEQDARTIDAAMAAGAPDIVVVMLGAADRVSLRRPNGRRAAVGSDEWKEDYARRLDAVMRAWRKKSVAVFWIGLPVMRREDVNDDAEVMNELFRSRALANGVRLVDISGSFAEPDKSYNAHGPDIAGKTRLLRDQDGVHFTWAGYRKLAYFVERELKRAAAQAWDERTIPLAGTEAEQARIRPPPTVKLAPLAIAAKGGTATDPTGVAGKARSASGAAGSSTAGRSADGGAPSGGLRAETSRITLKNISDQGREESVSLEILRPAIPATVLALLTRRESADTATNVGDTVMTEILGGLTVVSSITPSADPTGEKRRGTASPLLRVLQRGESLPPKPGRADEMPWPRPEPVLDPKLALTATPADSAATPAAAPTSPAAVRAAPANSPRRAGEAAVPQR